MKKIKYFLMLIVLAIALSLLSVVSCEKDSPTGPKKCYLTWTGCNNLKIEGCSSMTIEVESFNALGWPIIVKYSGCGKSGKAKITYQNNGCIEKIEEM